MRRYVFSLALIAAAVLGPPLALGNDQQIAQTIVERLQAQKKAGNLKGFSLDLQVEEGEVWLTGRVSSAEQQSLTLDIARRVPGVKQVVNDITVEQPAPAKTANRNLFASIGSKVRQAVGQDDQQSEPAAIGTGVEGGNAYYAGAATAPAPIPAPAIAGPLPQQFAGPIPQQYAGPMPQYYYPRSNMPMAYAPARTIAHQNGVVPGDVAGPAHGHPVPMHIPGSTLGMAPARYDHPNMPGYAWPSYASHPNYAAVTYPKQYSPTAWPYIGPFYPYPQVPLGWRKVTLEWDDGWWMLDFKDRRH
ncbi:MAG TPA: BON domain-containing protein [Pirellulaceae bacterium]|nr:BON domain-containing protein [Pirellulaceae bacterium]